MPLIVLPFADPVVQSPVTFDQTTPTPIGSPPTKTPTTLKKTEQMPSKDVNQGDVDQGGVDQGDVNQGGVSSPESHPKLLLYIGFPVVTLIPLLLAFVHLVKSEQRFKSKYFLYYVLLVAFTKIKSTLIV